MNKTFKKVLSVLLAISMLTGIAAVGAYAIDTNDSAQRVSVSELERDEVYPTIIIHGIGQANTYLADDNGDPVYDDSGKEITGWPLYFNVRDLVIKLILPLMFTLITQKDCGLSDAIYNALLDQMSLSAAGDDGEPLNNIAVKGYDGRPISECTEEEKKEIFDRVPLDQYAQEVGEENLYYFAYNSFGDTYKIIDELQAIIEKAKKDTGKDKVNLVPISLGGAIATAYINEHPSGDGINKIVFIVPALDGSEIVGKVMANELDYSDTGLYRDMFTKLIGPDDYTGWLINIAVRILPKEVLVNVFSAAATGLSTALLSKSINMWGLVPNAMYDELAAEYLTDGTVLKAKADKFHEAQSNLVKNLKNYEKNGVKIYDISAYGLELYSLIDSDSNSDKIIHSASTSMGATFSKVGEALGEDYVQQNYKQYDYLSPDGQVDASTAAFPKTTWFFGGQDHEKIGSNDVVIRLATDLLLVEDMDVFTTTEYPQFNGHRNPRELKKLIAEANAVDISNLSETESTILTSALSNANALLEKTIIVDGELETAEARLTEALIAVGAKERESDTLDRILLVVCRTASELILKYWGPRGFTDSFADAVKQY
ncbi:MAG: hypothetical protein PUB20_00280 [Clostridia bacterium]|nr:hypothetical protein [Clostridia bacterium]